MSLVIIQDGDEVIQDPADIKAYAYDWDLNNLAPAVQIVTSTWTITPIYPSTTDTALIKDNDSRLSAAQATTALQRTVTVDNRATQIRLSVGTLGQIYEVANKIVTGETPAQTKERSFRVLIENK